MRSSSLWAVFTVFHVKFALSPSGLFAPDSSLWITCYPGASTGNCWCCCESHASKCSYLILIDCKLSRQWQVNGKCNLMHALHQHQTAAEESLKCSSTFGKTTKLNERICAEIIISLESQCILSIDISANHLSLSLCWERSRSEGTASPQAPAVFHETQNSAV